jgi:membrane-associated protease RseP (regulator of RpoE activity)
MSFKKVKPYLVFTALLLITLVTTTVSGVLWTTGKPFFTTSENNFGFPDQLDMATIWSGLSYSIPFLLILTIHEFGHYIAAKIHRVATTLPFYIPLWFFDLPSIGTLGAFIRIKDPILNRRHFFDIGVAGPLAGFAAAVLVLVYGFTHLPPADYVFSIHPEYAAYGADYASHVYEGKEDLLGVGDNLFMWLCRVSLVSDPAAVPNPYELIHYPYLFAGYLALFFTALNLLPIGQLDGGHVLYGFLGHRRFNQISPLLFTALVVYAGLGTISPKMPLEELMVYIPLYLGLLFLMFQRVYPGSKNSLMAALAIFAFHYVMALVWPSLKGNLSYLVFGFVLGRFLGVQHPPAFYDQELNPMRKAIGWLALIVFVLSFSPRPFY